jgi:hypothetical protein
VRNRRLRKTGSMNGNHRKLLAAACAVVGCGLALAACGGSATKPSAGTPSGRASSTLTMLNRYSGCMRDHSISGFPDPSTRETTNSFGIDGYNFDLPANLSTQSPAYESAQKACGDLISGGSDSGHHIPARAKQAALAHARCMRRHGVPNYPDPTFSANGVTQSQRAGGSGVNPRSPAFQNAQKACQP